MTAPRRSDGTRAAILTAARERFAADGFERATIRAIAADARIDPSLVMRYYGNKEKLFAAAAEFDLRLPDLTAVPPGEHGRALVAHFFTRWSEDETLLALIRAGVSHEAAAGRMREIFAAQVGPIAARLAPDPASAPTRAGLIATQILGFALCRFVLRLPPVTALSEAEAIAWLAPVVQRYLHDTI
ncbi:TetR family transcriptional regulator [Actinoplanes sp. SE50]|uniref:TetR/AcrR family transcriptional regulator n=1 Tax=unclassified Actinoplanes TaxID=2626549 RepID=UPI00023ED4D8|nr:MULTISPECIES: TetR family transcriptional regulator [unclassified Actinoplanes]AEV87317.1 TetR family transcriptional regulator [Actinoplanes sp. SE50/110]ATO85717.1 TetR family transcriptional regulator [Actinoplanes sp. SE50]SLM03130.1 TetR family transcriptional regulator [Actinoplanes sp. SE50/110]